MKARDYLINVCFTCVLFIAMLVMMLVKCFAPAMVLPKADIPNQVLLSMVALLADYFIAPGAKKCYICVPMFSIISIALLAGIAGIARGAELARLAVVGGAVFTACTFLFTSAVERMASGPATKRAAAVCALALYLAAQGFAGICL